mmetsp:Transcript_7740/g.23162  ORF Transcript_7740/g.23162 Transcript_7740/m.23162 type:complete len:290 (+) Transcript_7740:82-951(+)
MPGKALSFLSFCFFFLSALSYFMPGCALSFLSFFWPSLSWSWSLAISLCLHSSTSLPLLTDFWIESSSSAKTSVEKAFQSLNTWTQMSSFPPLVGLVQRVLRTEMSGPSASLSASPFFFALMVSEAGRTTPWTLKFHLSFAPESWRMRSSCGHLSSPSDTIRTSELDHSAWCSLSMHLFMGSFRSLPPLKTFSKKERSLSTDPSASTLSSSSLTSLGPEKQYTKQPLSCSLAALMHSSTRALATFSLTPRMLPLVSTHSKIGPRSAVGLTSLTSGFGTLVGCWCHPSLS